MGTSGDVRTHIGFGRKSLSGRPQLPSREEPHKGPGWDSSQEDIDKFARMYYMYGVEMQEIASEFNISLDYVYEITRGRMKSAQWSSAVIGLIAAGYECSRVSSPRKDRAKSRDKLDTATVKRIRFMYEHGDTIDFICEETGTPRYTARSIIKNDTYTGAEFYGWDEGDG